MLVVETGSVVAGANSYVDVAGFKAVAANYADIAPFGLTDEELSRIILRAMQFIDACNFKGQKVDPFHTVSWPRVDVNFAPYVLYPVDKIPPELITALALLVTGVIVEGEDVLVPPQNVRREKVGQLEAEFYSNGGVGTESVWQQNALDLLKCFVKQAATLRV